MKVRLIYLMLALMLFPLGCRKKPKPVRIIVTLYQAVAAGDIEKARAFIEAGADVNKLDKNGNTPLNLAITKGQKDFRPRIGNLRFTWHLLSGIIGP